MRHVCVGDVIFRRTVVRGDPAGQGRVYLSLPLKKVSDKLGVMACYLLAVFCLLGGVYRTRQLLPLVREGQTAAAQIVGIHRGAKGLKTAVLAYDIESGARVTTRDILPMMIFRFKEGDTTTVLYHPADPTLGTIALGAWIWLQPVMFYSGFMMLCVLGLFLPKASMGRPSAAHRPTEGHQP